MFYADIHKKREGGHGKKTLPAWFNYYLQPRKKRTSCSIDNITTKTIFSSSSSSSSFSLFNQKRGMIIKIIFPDDKGGRSPIEDRSFPTREECDFRLCRWMSSTLWHGNCVYYYDACMTGCSRQFIHRLLLTGENAIRTETNTRALASWLY